MSPEAKAPASALRRALTGRPSLWRDAVIALASTGIGTVIRLLLASLLGGRGAWLVFYPAVMIAGAIAGSRAMLIALVTSSLVVWWAFIPRAGFAFASREDVDALCTFVAAAGLIGSFAAYLRLTLIRLWEAEDRLRLQADELNHRVKNALNTALAVATLSAPKSDEMKAFLADFAGRLHAIGRTNDLLTRNAWTAIDLSALLELELGPFGERVTMRGPALKMSANCAVSLSMIVHELATNAMKYGALSGEGRVDVNWRTRDGPDGRRAILTWIETGGPPMQRPATGPASGGGFGLRLIARLAEQQLHGAARLDLRPEGLRAEIDFLALAAP